MLRRAWPDAGYVLEKGLRSVHLLVVLALTGVAAVWFATRWGIGVSPDLVYYVTASGSLLRGQGMIIAQGETGAMAPLTLYPPLYPAVLAAIGLLGIEPLTGARLLAALLFGANILLIGLLIRVCVPYSRWAPVFGTWLMLTSTDVLGVHLFAWTEPLFIFLSLASLFLVACHIERPSRILLLATASALALATLTRFAGLAVVGAAVVGTVLLTRQPRAARLRVSVVMVAVSCLRSAAWAIRSHRTTGFVAGRILAFHPITLQKLLDALATVAGWLIPATLPHHSRAAVLLVAGLAAVNLPLLRRQARLSGNEPPALWWNLVRLLIIFVVVYALFLVTSLSFLDALTPLDGRILAPLFAAVLLASMCIGQRWLAANEHARALRALAVVLCVYLSGSYAYGAARLVLKAHDQGLGYTSVAWRRSETIAFVRDLPPETPVYSSAPEIIYSHLGRLTTAIPAKYNLQSLRANPDHSVEMARMRKTLEDGNGVVVYFSRIFLPSMPSQDELRELLPLRLVASASDGSVYALR
jgi:hypothetical protein